MQAIIDKLDRLADLNAQLERLDGDKQALVDQVLTPEVKARLAEIDAEFERKSEAAGDKISSLEAEIKGETLAHGGTVRGAQYQAVWNKGRQSWDDRGLGAYSESHPEVLQFRKQGEPSISIRRMTGS